MSWYDKIAKLYDFFTIWIYKKVKIELIENLDLKSGDRVLVIACGTGQSFKLIEEKIGNSGEIIALDYSIGILQIAQKRISKNNWKNIMKTVASLLKKNGKFGLLDWYRKNNDWLIKTVDYLAEAKTNRDTIAFAKEIFNEFNVVNHFLFNNVYVGVGKMQ